MNKWLEFLKNNDFIGIKKYIKENADVNDTNDSEESILFKELIFSKSKINYSNF